MKVYQRPVTKKLGQLLAEQEVITKEQLEDVLALQKARGGFVGQWLFSLGYVPERELQQKPGLSRFKNWKLGSLTRLQYLLQMFYLKTALR